jgi:hypothetical protein
VCLQPFDVGFEPAAGGNERTGPNIGRNFAMANCRRQEHAILDVQGGDFRIVTDFDAELFCREVERVEHRPAAAKEKRVSAAKTECATERGLKPHALAGDPRQHCL